MRVISQAELSRLELQELLRRVVAEPPHLAEGSHALRIAHNNLFNIRLMLACPLLRPN